VKTGIFVGLITLDGLYQTRRALAPNEKQVAEAMLLAAGGPATNAAIAFRALGGRAILVGALGQHPLTTVVRDDLAQHGVELVDLTPEAMMPPPFSSIVVNVATGDRAVISRNAADRPIPQTAPGAELLAEADCVLIDGHQLPVGYQLAQAACSQQVPVIIDAGSWKTGFEDVLALADVVIASGNFAPPNGGVGEAAIAYLQSLQVPQIAITQGEHPILYCTNGQSGTVTVPQITPVDTLGAGDIFHGAFGYHYLPHLDFVNALASAANVASLACQSFGTRHWLQQL
jgi:sugar/nucleoside kinase (ribokinase family)